MSANDAAFPNANVPIVDPRSGLASMWFIRWMSAIQNRTGGVTPSTPEDTAILGLMNSLMEIPATQVGAEFLGLMVPMDPPRAKAAAYPWMPSGAEGDTARNLTPVSITVGSSPYSYTAPSRGTVTATGGTVSATEFTRDGSTYIATGGSPIPVRKGDAVRVTYTVAPTMYFIPM